MSLLGMVQIGLEDYYIKWPSMMQDIVSCCNTSDINVLHRFLSVIDGICSKLEIVPDSDIVITQIRFITERLVTSLSTSSKISTNFCSIVGRASPRFCRK